MQTKSFFKCPWVRYIRKENYLKAVFDQARARDHLCLDIIADTGYYLGVGLANVANVLNLDLIILGGGAAKSADLLIPYIWKSLKKYCMPLSLKGLQIKQAVLGNDAGILGCAGMVFSNC